MLINRITLTAIAFCGIACAQVEPTAGAWQTWVIASGAKFRLPPPPSDAATAGEIQWLKGQIAGVNDIALAQIAYWNAGSPAYRWVQIASQEMVRRGIAAPLYTRDIALVTTAIYDATVAAWDTKYTYKRPHPSETDPSVKPLLAVPRSPSYPSEHAVAAGAAAAVLSYLFPDSAIAFSDLADEAARSRLYAGTQYPSDTIAGLQLGKMVGAAVVDYARKDGSDAVFSGSYPLTPTKWGNANPVTPLAGTWQPWVLSAGNQLRLDPPPANDSPDFAAQVAGVKGFVRTNTTNHSAWFWQPSFVTPWLDTVHRELFENNLAANPPRAARAYALATIAQHDATIACWDTKFAYLELRPSLADSTVTTLFANPGHPGFPSGHACASGASGAILGYLFPADAGALTDQATDAGLSTFYAGIHTMFDVGQGLKLGQSVAAKLIERASEDGSQ